MSVLPEDYELESNNSQDYIDDEGNNYETPQKKRKLYSDGGSTAQKAKLTSVQRLIMLCIVPQIKETYDNVKQLFSLIQINKISFKFVSDFKLLLIVNGQQTATSTFPCPYCFVSLQDLKNSEKKSESVRTSNSENERSNNFTHLKTYGDLKQDYKSFCDKGKNKKNAKFCHSTINLPLFEEDDSVCVIQKCVIPELHVLTGFVNHLFWDCLVPLVGLEKALIWPIDLKLVPKNYHGNVFEGNACRELLKQSKKLNNPKIYADVGKLSLVPIINAFKSMDKVVNCCFSAKKKSPNLDKYINKLTTSIEATEVSRTLKIHVAVKHIQECLHFLDGRGLGVWSEQAGEAIHREFLKYWDKYKMNCMSDLQYSARLKKAVVEFSSHHI